MTIIILAFSFVLLLTLILFYLLYRVDSGSHHHDFNRHVIFCIALISCFAGLNKLNRDGFGKITKYYVRCSVIFVISFLVLILVLIYFLPFSKRVGTLVIEIVYYSYLAAIAGMLPLSFYLKHKQKKSITESIITDAN